MRRAVAVALLVSLVCLGVTARGDNHQPQGVNEATGWITWTSPTTSWTSNVTWTGDYRVVGKTFEGRLRGVLTGAPTSATLTFDLPAGILLHATFTGNPCGGTGYDGAIIYGPWSLSRAALTTLTVRYNTTSSTLATVSQAAPFAWGNGHNITIYVNVEIQ